MKIRKYTAERLVKNRDLLRLTLSRLLAESEGATAFQAIRAWDAFKLGDDVELVAALRDMSAKQVLNLYEHFRITTEGK